MPAKIGHEELRDMQPCTIPEICIMLLAIALLNCALHQQCSSHALISVFYLMEVQSLKQIDAVDVVQNEDSNQQLWQ